MTSNGTLAKPNCAKGLRAGRNEIPVTQALNINTRWVVGGGWKGMSVGACLSVRGGSDMHLYVWERGWPRWRRQFRGRGDGWTHPPPTPMDRLVSGGRSGGGQLWFWIYSHFCSAALWTKSHFQFCHQLKKKLAATSKEQPEKPPKSTAQLFTISWLSEICVILINLGIRRLKYRTCINL